MASTFVEPRGIPTIFGEILEKNVTFCIDTSGSMYKGMEMVKEQLVETLKKMASTGKPYSFNIIEFNSEVNQWSDKLVTCTPQTVSVAQEWINKISAKTGTNTRDALLTALQDPLCGAVYLVTDGLPDQHPVEILEHVASISGMRPLHCIYLSTEDSTESAAIEFLEDLAIESYGSFHIVTLTTHGCVERITPIYRADHAQERIIRTINGTIRPNIQRCSLATTLQVDPDESINYAPRVLGGQAPQNWFPPWGPYWYDWLGMPLRYYYPYAWSRYRPAKGWIKAQEAMTESIEMSGLSPAAGSLLLNKAVLARRMEDGYFYKANVKSQIMSDKFLVGFGPCKHGKYTDTVYQDTHVYDIIDYEDARRHTILTGDRVLAPWEPEGERYGPGTVIEGHEKRNAEGRYEVAITQGPDDKAITVSFTNGKVSSVPVDTSIWIPKEVFERITLELKMPREARESLMSEERYPEQSKQGYPTSGPTADPRDYDMADPLCFDYDPMVVERRGGPWRYPFHPPYPLILKKGIEKQACVSETVEKKQVVPGTSITQQQLDDKIASQLLEHKLLLDEKENEKGTRKCEQESRKVMEEGREFSEECQRRREQRRDLSEECQKRRDQGRQLSEECQKSREQGRKLPEDLQRRLEEVYGQWQEEKEKEKELILSQIDRERLLKKREKQDEIGLRKTVCFDETSKGVNTESSLLERPRTSSRLVTRRPQWKKYWRADPGMPIGDCLGGPPRGAQYEQGTIHMRRCEDQRQKAWNMRIKNYDNMSEGQLQREQDRQVREQRQIEQAREQKKYISKEIREKIEVNQKRELDREQLRLKAMQQRRERRENIQQQREKQIEETQQRRAQRLDQEEACNAMRDQQHRNAKMHRIQHFQ
ncbi:CK016-like protein, partial [Mya arenaria]